MHTNRFLPTKFTPGIVGSGLCTTLTLGVAFCGTRLEATKLQNYLTIHNYTYVHLWSIKYLHDDTFKWTLLNKLFLKMTFREMLLSASRKKKIEEILKSLDLIKKIKLWWWVEKDESKIETSIKIVFKHWIQESLRLK